MNVVMSNNYFNGNVGSNFGGAVAVAGIAATGAAATNFTSVRNIFTGNEVTLRLPCSARTQRY